MAEPGPNLFYEGLAAAQRGDFARAEAIARSLLSANPDDVGGHQIVGFMQFRRGRNEEALQAFLAANRATPDQPEILYWIGLLLKERGAYADAEKALAEAVRLRPEYGDAHCQRGEALHLLGRGDDARRAFETAIRIEPDSPAILAKAARYFERSHDIPRARALTEQSLAKDPDNEVAQIALAELDLREGHVDAVIEKLRPLLESNSGNRRNSARLKRLLADACDRKGFYKEAFLHYRAANEIQRSLFAESASREQSPLTPGNLTKLIEFFSAEDFAAWTEHDALEGGAPAFLLGFVRSGTTWLDQILSSHPEIVVMEEEDNFADAWRELLMSRTGLERLRSLSEADVNKFRSAYWRRAQSAMKADPAGRVVVDKLPLNTMQMCLIHRIFPEAKVMFVLRDPRDAILSAFQQHFAINAAMLQFLDLRAAADFYGQVMTLGALYREMTPLQVQEIRYEDVVRSFENTARAMIRFLGLEWDDALFEYDKTARQRTILTPSAKQVIQKPYTSSIGKWRNYHAEMAPILPDLAKWVRAFGYEPD